MTYEQISQLMRDHGIGEATIDRLMRVPDIVGKAREVSPQAWIEPLADERAPDRRRSLLVAAAEVGG